MDILNTIEKVRVLITQRKANDASELIEEIILYTYDNFITISGNKQLIQKISDCLLLGGNQILEVTPNNLAYYYLAVSSALVGDVKGLCRNISTFIEEERKSYGERYVSDDFEGVLSIGRLIAEHDQNTLLRSIENDFENNYPESAATYYLKASIIKNDDTEQKMKYLQKSIEIDSEFAWSLYDIALYYYKNKNWKNAIIYLEKAIRLNFNDDNTFELLAICYGKLKDHKNEIVYYKKCLELDPKYPYAMNSLGYAYEKYKDYEQALACYHKSIGTNDGGNYPYQNIFRLLKKIKNYDEAIAFWQANQRKFPKSATKTVDELRKTKNKIEEQQIVDYVAEEQQASRSSPQTEKKSSRKMTNSFSVESRVEAQIEEDIIKGKPFYNLPLKMYDESDGYGRQYMIPSVGRIDLLTVHSETNDLYVIELKRGLGDDEVIGQVSRYMGWVKQNIATKGQNVFGIVCVAQASDKLMYAVDANQDIFIYKHSFSISHF